MIIFIARNKFSLRNWIELALIQKEIEKKKRTLDDAVREERDSNEIQNLKNEIISLVLKKNSLEKSGRYY